MAHETENADYMASAIAGLQLGEFKPCVMQYDEIGRTEIILEDTLIVWRPWGPPGHCVDLGYAEDGRLVAMAVWDRVATRTTG